MVSPSHQSAKSHKRSSNLFVHLSPLLPINLRLLNDHEFQASLLRAVVPSKDSPHFQNHPVVNHKTQVRSFVVFVQFCCLSQYFECRTSKIKNKNGNHTNAICSYTKTSMLYWSLTQQMRTLLSQFLKVKYAKITIFRIFSWFLRATSSERFLIFYQWPSMSEAPEKSVASLPCSILVYVIAC